jgi:hypothetical protein
LFTLAIAAGTGLLLALPWIPNLAGGVLGQEVAEGMARAAPLAESLDSFRVWRDLAVYVPGLFTLAALAGAIWGLFRRDLSPFSLVFWILLMVAYSFGGPIQLPAAHFFQNFSILIMVYIPAGVLCGYFFAELQRVFARIQPRLVSPLAAGLLVLLAVWGFKGQARIADPVSFGLFTRPDQRAMAWIEAQAPSEARFLVEGFTIYEGRSSVGADAGWWIPQLAGRANTMPPQYALFNERPSDPGYSNQVTALVSLLENQPAASPAGIAALCAQDVTHVYIGQRQGKVGADAHQLFAPQEFLESPSFRPVYHQDRVYIFALDPAACPEQE